jgi:hypothetical protein
MIELFKCKPYSAYLSLKACGSRKKQIKETIAKGMRRYDGGGKVQRDFGKFTALNLCKGCKGVDQADAKTVRL